ncbi:leucyl aminopeptidase [Candidatus Uhrbacteria bacterium]|nr:leucyl aminopeptidase [Candidatus Uhrbacteria bacterium]
MQLRFAPHTPFARIREDALVLPLFQGEKEPPVSLPAAARTLVTGVISSREFAGAHAETHVLSVAEGRRIRKICLVGLGDRKELTSEELRKAIGAAVMRLKKARVTRMALWMRSNDYHAAALGALLASYHFAAYKKKKDAPTTVQSMTLYGAVADRRDAAGAFREATVLARALTFVKDMGNTPPNVLTPAALADHAVVLAKGIPGLTVTVLKKADIVREKMGGLLGVSQGSQHEPRCIVLEYRGKTDQKPIALVGKAITFDSGGISIKPSQKMDEMKFDMCGGAAVIGTVVTAARLQLPVHLVGIVCAAENVPSHTSYKPGDILTFADGSTCEVLNTDAEGRIVVADGMIYSRRYKPETIITIATLTGAIVAALADYATGLFADDRDLVAALTRAGAESGERVWEMPMPKAWAEHVKSPVADIRNIPAMKIADASIGALFLKYFVEKKTRFAHLDIAGTAWQSGPMPYEEVGATGVGVRLLIEYLRNQLQHHENMKA